MKKRIFLMAGMVLSSAVLADVNYLDAETRLLIPASVSTVRQAADYFLEPHKFHLVERTQESQSIGNRPVPVGMNGQIMTVEEALLAITTEEDAIVIDKDHRLVMFNELKKELSQ